MANEDLWRQIAALPESKRVLVLQRLRSQGWATPIRPGPDLQLLTGQPDIDAEAFVDPDIKPTSGVSLCAQPQNVFLTGGTGFLGAFLLHELCVATRARLFALVRAPSEAAGKERILANLRHYSLPTEEIAERLVPVVGDLEKPCLGLTAEMFQQLGDSMDAVYHSGALLNFLYGYDAFLGPNIIGTQEALRLACAQRTKPFHLVSTLKFFMMNLSEVRTPVEEMGSLDRGRGCVGGYSQSKWVSEKMTHIVRERGLTVTIHRCGLVWGDSRNGACHDGEIFSRMLQSAVQVGALPGTYVPMYVAPVDYVARAIVSTSLCPAAANHVFHHGAPEPANLFPVQALNEAGYAIETTDFATWATKQASSKNALTPLMPFITALWPGKLMTWELLSRVPPLLTGSVQQFDAQLNYPPIGACLHTCIERMIRTGQIPPPQASRKSV